jgi:hypothetical protein
LSIILIQSKLDQPVRSFISGWCFFSNILDVFSYSKFPPFHVRSFFSCACLKYIFIGNSSFAVHLKLHPGIRFSHPSSKTCFPPSYVESVTGSDNSYSINLIRYELTLASSDWRYPFDLCGSIYRLSDVRSLFTTSETNATRKVEDGHLVLPFSNPNDLEVFGNELFWNDANFSSKYRYCLTSARHVLSVVTINRVQSTYDVPVFVHQFGELDYLNKHHLKFLLNDGRLVDRCLNYNLQKYRTALFLSVHVGDCLLQNQEKKPLCEYHYKVGAVERPISISRVSL